MCEFPDTADADTCGRPARDHRRTIGRMRFPILCRVLVACTASAVFAASGAAAESPPSPRLAVLDVELSGDLGGSQFVAEHEARLKMASARLREDLGRSGLYQIVDIAAAQAVIDELKSRQLYLHDCNGCDLEVGRKLGADQMFVAWVNRVSGLILTLTFEIHDVASGQLVARKSYDFRGDNDSAWTHAIDYMVRDLKESSAAQPHSKN